MARRRRSLCWLLTLALLPLLGSSAGAQPAVPTLSLDDSPIAPVIGPPGFGHGAENPWGIPVTGFPPGLAPSPSLQTIIGLVFGDGDLLRMGPALQIVGPSPYISAFSTNTIDSGWPMYLALTVDRVSQGVAGSAVATQAALNQQPSDIYKSGSLFWDPARYIGNLGSGPFAGYLNTHVLGPPSTTLLVDDSALGLRSAGSVVPPNVAAGPIGTGTHDNLDVFEMLPADQFRTGRYDDWAYFTVYPDMFVPYARPGPDIYDIPQQGTGVCGLPAWGSAAAMGLHVLDVIDSLIVYDNGTRGSPSCNGPGAQPGVDAVLFSLAPGSPSLLLHGLTAADVFFSDFTGAFAVYARGSELGLVGSSGGTPGGGDNVDGHDLICLGDITNNGVVELIDVQIILSCYLVSPCGDLNMDGRTDQVDLWLVAQNYGCRS